MINPALAVRPNMLRLKFCISTSLSPSPGREGRGRERRTRRTSRFLEGEYVPVDKGGHADDCDVGQKYWVGYEFLRDWWC